MTDRRPFPFDAVVGHDDAKLALRLAALDPLIGGVLLRGQKGSAKTTLARGLAVELRNAPFVELPLGASEDRVVGTLDTRAALTGGEVRFHPGLLAAADGGVLYVDEINLLADHLVDVLLDVAVSGENIVERDGISHRHPARFVLVGSMNPEEGELRPQLLDRLGLCVNVMAPAAVADRVEAVRRRLAFDAGQLPSVEPSAAAWLPADGTPTTSDEVFEAATQLALAVGAEGLRADLTLCRAAAALARAERRPHVDVDDLRRVAPLVLAHRSRRGPFDPPVVPPEELQRSIDDALDDPGDSDAADPEDGDRPTDGGEGGAPAADDRPMGVGAMRRPPVPSQRTERSAARGRVVGDRPAGPTDAIAVVPTVRNLAARRAGTTDGHLAADDLRAAVRSRRRRRTIVLCVDLSGSMGAPERADVATGTVLGLLTTAYEDRQAVALVTFRGEEATTVVSPTTSVEIVRNRLDGLTTGGATPLAAGLAQALDVAERSSGEDADALLVVLTDGRATGDDGVEQAHDVAARISASRTDALVLDCETGTVRLGLAAQLAAAMGARCVNVSSLEPATVVTAIARHVDTS